MMCTGYVPNDDHSGDSDDNDEVEQEEELHGSDGMIMIIMKDQSK